MDPSPADYTSWSHADLINRVTSLESQLRTALASTNSSPGGPPAKKFKQSKSKTPKPFDPSKYSTRLIALKFAYLGKRYNGFEYHKNNSTRLTTVEEELYKALEKTKLILPSKDGKDAEYDWTGCEYSKCGRTDKGVSAFGQVIGIKVRSSRPRPAPKANPDAQETNGVVDGDIENPTTTLQDSATTVNTDWDSIHDELPYIQHLNRVLPPDIRILAWCPNPPSNFSARFHCRERRYRYFFTNPAYTPYPGSGRKDSGWLDIEVMRSAAKKLEGLHDFRNFCKLDASKQITNFHRRIFHADIHPVMAGEEAGAFLSRPPFAAADPTLEEVSDQRPQLYYFEVRGSAFLWHQVRHMVAVLFLIGQGHEPPSIIDELLDIEKTPSKPNYEMASDVPLVLWDCIFPSPEKAAASTDHGEWNSDGYDDALDWVYIGDERSRASGGEGGKGIISRGAQDNLYGRLGLMEDLWALWRSRKIDEVLAGSLMDKVSRLAPQHIMNLESPEQMISGEISARVFDGSETPRTVGRYVPIMQRERMETAEVLNKRWADRKGARNGDGGAAAKVEEGSLNDE